MRAYLLALFIILNYITNIRVFSSTIEISKPSLCKEAGNDSTPCPSKTLIVETDPTHGFIISVQPFTVSDNDTKEADVLVPKPRKVDELDETINEELKPEEKLFLPLNVDAYFPHYDLSNETSLETTNDSSVDALTVEDKLSVDDSDLVEDCTKNCPGSCERTFKDGNLTLFTSSCGMNYTSAEEFCKKHGEQLFIPRLKGDNDIIFDFGADFYKKDKEFEFFWYPMKRPNYGEEAVWADGAEFEAYETPFYGDSNSNQYRCFVFKKDDDSLMTYDQFCRVTNSRPVCKSSS